MTRSINRWLRSRNGIIAVLAVLILILALAIWFGLGPGAGTVLTPPGGYTCMPVDCALNGDTIDWVAMEGDGKFFSMPGENMVSFDGAPIMVWISVDGNASNFEVGLFDGDSGKHRDNSGTIALVEGNWDNTTSETTYTLYADPGKDGQGSFVVGQWTGNTNNATAGDGGNGAWTTGAAGMPNHAWYDITINTHGNARDANSGDFYYRLEATRPLAGSGINAFKLRSSGYLSSGRSDLVDATFAIVGMIATAHDVPYLWPGNTIADWANPASMNPSTYTGDWEFFIYVPNDAVALEFWDGDFDRGATAAIVPGDADLDDDNTPNEIPAFAVGTNVRPEGAQGLGAPADDHFHWAYRRSPQVFYEVIDPAGTPILTNNEPSGTSEWERYVVSTDAGLADGNAVVSGIAPGVYRIHISGLDLHNTVWLRGNFEICSSPELCGCPGGDCETEYNVCPRTIGYWKNNVKKVLIDNKRTGVQESRASLEHALNVVAQTSPIYRTGINVNAPSPIAAAVRLTDAEANAILQKTNGNSMLDRALQQNLATWLNVASGKLSPEVFVSLDAAGGTFEGTVYQALQEAQSIILNEQGDQARLERAKDLADLMNNGLLGEEAESSTCGDYETVMPPDQQPPPPNEVPRSDPGPEVPPVEPEDPPTADVCTEYMDGNFNIENPATNPFYGVKFNYQGNAEVKDGDSDYFAVTVSADTAAAMSASGISVEAKAGQIDETTTLSCQFDQAVSCQASTDNFVFTFLGASTNGDGSLTLSFLVQNVSRFGISHVTIGLPDGASAGICVP